MEMKKARRMAGLFSLNWIRCGSGGGGGGLFGDGGAGLADVGDDDFGRMSRTNALREGDVGNVQGLAFGQVGNVDFERFGKVVGKADDFHCVDVLLEHASGFHACRLTVEVSGDVGGDLGLFVDGEEVGVQDRTIERVVLDGLEECEAGAFAFDIEVDKEVFGAAMGEKLGEGLRVDLQVVGFDATSVNDGRQPAFAAHLFEASGTAAGAGCCFE